LIINNHCLISCFSEDCAYYHVTDSQPPMKPFKQSLVQKYSQRTQATSFHW